MRIADSAKLVPLGRRLRTSSYASPSRLTRNVAEPAKHLHFGGRPLSEWTWRRERHIYDTFQWQSTRIERIVSRTARAGIRETKVISGLRTIQRLFFGCQPSAERNTLDFDRQRSDTGRWCVDHPIAGRPRCAPGSRLRQSPLMKNRRIICSGHF